MLEFRPVKLKDKEWMKPILLSQNSRSADFCFGNIYVWDRKYKLLAARYEDSVILKNFEYDVPMYSYPAGRGDLKSAVDEIIADARSGGYTPVLCGVEKNGVKELTEIYNGAFTFEQDTDESDYIYLAEKLSTFSGKTLHGQKNHCNRFEKEHEWEFKKLTREMIPECLDMLRSWTETNKDRLDRSIILEHDAAMKGFASYESLDFLGGVLFADGQIAGYSVGERNCDDTFDVHFEKALADMPGAYTMVCREMTKLAVETYEGIKYINREEDMGLERLRKAKMELKPEFILEKYIGTYLG